MTSHSTAAQHSLATLAADLRYADLPTAVAENTICADAAGPDLVEVVGRFSFGEDLSIAGKSDGSADAVEQTAHDLRRRDRRKPPAFAGCRIRTPVKDRTHTMGSDPRLDGTLADRDLRTEQNRSFAEQLRFATI
jgi:hypothetical protein